MDVPAKTTVYILRNVCCNRVATNAGAEKNALTGRKLLIFNYFLCLQENRIAILSELCTMVAFRDSEVYNRSGYAVPLEPRFSAPNLVDGRRSGMRRLGAATGGQTRLNRVAGRRFTSVPLATSGEPTLCARIWLRPEAHAGAERWWTRRKGRCRGGRRRRGVGEGLLHAQPAPAHGQLRGPAGVRRLPVHRVERQANATLWSYQATPKPQGGEDVPRTMATQAVKKLLVALDKMPPAPPERGAR